MQSEHRPFKTQRGQSVLSENPRERCREATLTPLKTTCGPAPVDNRAQLRPRGRGCQTRMRMAVTSIGRWSAFRSAVNVVECGQSGLYLTMGTDKADGISHA